MNWNIKLGTIKGIGIYMHLTFLLLLIGVGGFGLLKGHSLITSLGGIVYVILLFGIVVLHELGHSLTARFFNINTKRITLLPIGGVAQLERIPENPTKELLISVAGPAVNVVIALALFAISLLASGFSALTGMGILSSGIVSRLIWVNLFIAGFNLLPAFPMDGGRIFRALLAFKKPYVSATKIALQMGKIMAVLFGIVGLFTNPFLIIIAIFIWIAGSQEYETVKLKHTWKSTFFPETAFENMYIPKSNFWVHVPKPNDSLNNRFHFRR